MLWSEWAWFFFQSLIPLVSFPTFWILFQVHQLQWVSPLSSCFTVFSALWLDPSIFLSFYFLSYSLWVARMVNKFFFLLASFSHLCQLVVFYYSLSDSKSSQVSRTILSILANLNSDVVYMVLIVSLIFISFGLFFNNSGTVTIGITATHMFHNFFHSLTRSENLSIFLLSFIFTLWSVRMARSTWWQVLFFILISTRSSRLSKLGDLFVSQNPWRFYSSHSRAYTIW